MVIHEYMPFIIILLLAVLILVMLGERVKIAYPIFLVLSGLGLSMIPGVPRIQMDPELVFLIFLPTILYEAAWYTPWQEFYKYKRHISLLAFGLVIFTSLIVALVAESMIPGFTLALGFLLGGIISPPDAVAATSVLKRMRVPKRVLAILEGESLINDASSLIVFKFALAAVITHQFAMGMAIQQFFLVAGMGTVVGLVIGGIMYLIHRYVPTSSHVDTALALLTPYMMYIGAEHFHFSGVMAVVAGGLFLSYHSHRILTHESRLQATGFWSTLVFLMNGTIFILIGLEMSVIRDNMNGFTMSEGIQFGIIISLVVIFVRFLWTYFILFVPRELFAYLREPPPDWRDAMIISVAAMRGVVSLAAAFSIPLLLPTGEAFPQRNIILFVTFVVIMITLVGQGLILPLLLKFLDIKEKDELVDEDEQEAMIGVLLKKAALKQLMESYGTEINRNQLVANLKRQLETQIDVTYEKKESLEGIQSRKEELYEYQSIMRNLIHVQRKELARLRSAESFADELLREQGVQLDLDEARISTIIA